MTETPSNTSGGTGADDLSPFDPVARLANLTQRPTVLPLFGRRDAADESPDVPADVAEISAVEEPAPSDSANQDDGASPFAPAAEPTPAQSAGPAIGRLSRVRAIQLWPDGAAMARWLCAEPDSLADALGSAPLHFEPTASNIVLGTDLAGEPVCAVCEVGPSTDEGLGVLLRIAAVQDGGTVVWVSGEPGDAHGAALSWLNRSTSPRFYFVRASGARIDGSASAAVLDLVVRPARATDLDPETAATPPREAPRRRVDDHLPG